MEIKEICGIVIGVVGLSGFGVGTVGLVRQLENNLVGWQKTCVNYGLLALCGNAMCAIAVKMLP